MKHIFMIILMIISVCFCSCAKEKEVENQNIIVEENSSDSYHEIPVENVNYNKLPFEHYFIYEDVNWIPDKETAIDIAVDIFESMEKSVLEEEFEPFFVRYDEQNKIWIVTFGKPLNPDSFEQELSYDISIALSQEDGTVINVWFCE